MEVPLLGGTPLLGSSNHRGKSLRATIGRGRINPTVKLRLPRGKARQIAWMSTVPGNHDQYASLHIPDGTGVRVKKSFSFTSLDQIFFLIL